MKGKKKLLIIDDEVLYLEVLKERLLAEGFDVETVSDGASGIEKAAGFDPDTILLDISMSVMDGYEVLENLKGNNKTKNIPVVVISAKIAEIGHRKKALELGAHACISKPFDIRKLLSILSRIGKRPKGDSRAS